ncbi:LLM class flavin-dependent oxidoreductase [Alicyclobacillus pomorum]|jgi:luciferase family oxidoreductase group 1|uniref:LLM class flavin-dependent oxidoreductase n=1 Tax=Alicyclobacillus pomorum TaxID=204470 RepID=UPI0004290700|nr:LLM class flavin-dependent oxidoreductase [Alicyclobacillus pomorum]
MKLSVLDQSPIAHGSNARAALLQTVQIAQLAERLGYHRFWVSEHHDSSALAGSTPEILITHLAAKTNTIRVGSGGVMLPHYSAYKVAENFRMLEALYPNRIDVGLGRAPGGMPRSTMALQEGKLREPDYAQQVEDLMAYLTDTLPADHRFAGLTAAPVVDTVPEMWLLGSSDFSAITAADKGTAYMFAHFINGDGGVEAVEAYQRRFKPSVLYDKPKASVAIFVICADTDAEADRIASSLDLALVMLANGQRRDGIPTIEMALSYPYSKYELALVRENRKRMIVGSPSTVKQQIEELARAYHTDEVMIVTNTAQFEHRQRSFELVAEAFGLPKGRSH